MVKNIAKLQKVVFLCISECCQGTLCNLNVIDVLGKQGHITAICSTFLLTIPKFNFLPTHEAKIRP